MEQPLERMSDEEFKPILLKAITNQIEKGGDYVRICFCNIPRSRYPESVWLEYCSDGTYGETWRRVIKKLFPEEGELYCARLWPNMEGKKMPKYDFNNLSGDERKEILDAVLFREKDDEELIKKRNEVIDALEAEYPFLKPRGYDDNPSVMKPEERYCELSMMPYGWLIAFGLELCRDMKRVAEAEGYLENLRIHQVKEKMGYLHLYLSHESDAMENVITKYEFLSEHTCIICGKPATQVSQGWISPYCDKCVEKMKKGDENMPYEKKFVLVDDYFGKIGADRFRTCYGFEDVAETETSPETKHSVNTTEIWNWKDSKWDFYSKVILTESAREKHHEFFDKLEALNNEEVNKIIREFDSML